MPHKNKQPFVVKRILLIASAGAGGKAVALREICNSLDDAGITYTLKKVHTKQEMRALKLPDTARQHDAVFVYGGDGTVLKAGHALRGGKVPLCIVPGGTNNGLAVSLGQELSPLAAVQAVIEGRYRLENIDTASFGERAIIFDMHWGVLAKTVANTKRQLKQAVGSLAYAIEGIRQLRQAEDSEFILKYDGKKITAQAIACYISNAGLPRFLGMSIFKSHRPNDGQLDVALVKTNKFWPLLWWYVGKALFGRGSSRVVGLGRARKVEVLAAPAQAFYDDQTIAVKTPFTIATQVQTLPVIVPIPSTFKQRLRSTWLQLVTQFWRGVDQLRRVTLGASATRFSQLNDHLFVGGQPNRFWGARRLQRWGITAVVSLRTRTPRHVPHNVDILHLPTPNYEPVTLADLHRGCVFIDEHIKKGGNVYVHCQAGEGRAASMTIAYLISQGMFLNDALAFIKQHRLFIRPNQRQIARLREFARQLNHGQSSRSAGQQV